MNGSVSLTAKDAKWRGNVEITAQPQGDSSDGKAKEWRQTPVRRPFDAHSMHTAQLADRRMKPTARIPINLVQLCRHGSSHKHDMLALQPTSLGDEPGAFRRDGSERAWSVVTGLCDESLRLWICF